MRAALLLSRRVGVRCGGVAGWVRCGWASRRRASCTMCRCGLFVRRWCALRRGHVGGFVRTLWDVWVEGVRCLRFIAMTSYCTPDEAEQSGFGGCDRKTEHIERTQPTTSRKCKERNFVFEVCTRLNMGCKGL